MPMGLAIRLIAAFTGVGILLLVGGIWMVVTDDDDRIKVTGTVLTAERVQKDDHPALGWESYYEVKYEYKGEPYTASMSSPGLGREEEPYPPKSQVSLWIDPNNPQRSSLKSPSNPGWILIVFSVGCLVFVLVVWKSIPTSQR